MANLSTLPQELIVLIGEELDEDDLLALRMTSKEFNDKAKESHLRLLYDCRLIFFNINSFENLVKVAHHPSGMNLRVRSIRIYLQNVYLDSDPMENLQDSRDIPPIMMKIWKDSSMLKEETRRILQWGEEVHMLTQAFNNLPNLQNITFDASEIRFSTHGMRRSIFNLYFPSAGMAPGKRISYDLRRLYTSFCHAYLFDGSGYFRLWRGVVNSIIVADLKNVTQIVTFPPPSCLEWTTVPYSIPQSWFECSPLQATNFRTAFSNLRTLDLSLKWEPHDEAINHSFSWLQMFGSTLTNLSISGDTRRRYHDHTDNHRINSNKYGIYPDLSLPRLQKLSLVNFCFILDAFLGFFSNIGSDLRELEIIHCRMEDSKEDWFNVLKLVGERSLKRFHLIPLPNPSDEYRLPSIDFSVINTGMCIVGYPPLEQRGYVQGSFTPLKQKDLSKELENHNNTDSFWDCISDATWKDEATWKIRRLIRPVIWEEAEINFHPEDYDLDAEHYGAYDISESDENGDPFVFGSYP